MAFKLSSKLVDSTLHLNLERIYFGRLPLLCTKSINRPFGITYMKKIKNYRISRVVHSMAGGWVWRLRETGWSRKWWPSGCSSKKKENACEISLVMSKWNWGKREKNIRSEIRKKEKTQALTLLLLHLYNNYVHCSTSNPMTF